MLPSSSRGNHGVYSQDNMVIVGNHNEVNGANCKVTGNHNKINGAGCQVVGNHNMLHAKDCTVSGDHNSLYGINCFASGSYNQAFNAVEEDTFPAISKKRKYSPDVEESGGLVSQRLNEEKQSNVNASVQRGTGTLESVVRVGGSIKIPDSGNDVVTINGEVYFDSNREGYWPDRSRQEDGNVIKSQRRRITELEQQLRQHENKADQDKIPLCNDVIPTNKAQGNEEQEQSQANSIQKEEKEDKVEDKGICVITKGKKKETNKG